LAGEASSQLEKLVAAGSGESTASELRSSEAGAKLWSGDGERAAQITTSFLWRQGPLLGTLEMVQRHGIEPGACPIDNPTFPLAVFCK